MRDWIQDITDIVTACRRAERIKQDLALTLVTLLAQWMASQPDQGKSLAWLSTQPVELLGLTIPEDILKDLKDLQEKE